MAQPLRNNELWRLAAREGLTSLIEILENAEAEGSLNSPENFAAMLSVGLNRLNLTASDLVNEEQISKAAVSRWLSGLATPAAPTRKHVINWIKQKAGAQLLELTP